MTNSRTSHVLEFHENPVKGLHVRRELSLSHVTSKSKFDIKSSDIYTIFMFWCVFSPEGCLVSCQPHSHRFPSPSAPRNAASTQFANRKDG